MYVHIKLETQHLLVFKIMDSGASDLRLNPSSISYYFYALGQFTNLSVTSFLHVRKEIVILGCYKDQMMRKSGWNGVVLFKCLLHKCLPPPSRTQGL